MVKIVDKTLEELLLFIRRTITIEGYSMENGLLQGCPIILLFMGLSGLIIITLLSHNIFILVSLYILSLILAYFSKIRIRDYIIRTWIFIPLFTLIVAIPATLNIFTPGEKIFELGLNGIYITREGVLYVSTFMMRTATMIAYVILMISILGWRKLEYVLDAIRIPHVIIDILNMTYRYIFLLIYTSYEILLSIKSRLNIKIGYKDSMEIGSKVLSFLFLKTLRKGELIYLSMLSRGYGSPYSNSKSYRIRMPNRKTIQYLLLFSTLYVIVFLMEAIFFG